MSEFSQGYSRRKFLVTAGVSAASTIFLKGCLGNPPEPTGNTGNNTASSPAITQVPAVNISPEQAPEVTAIKLGFIPIVESAPLI
ncbi:MAG: bicarbonate-binding protein, partial [Planktothrix sp.]